MDPLDALYLCVKPDAWEERARAVWADQGQARGSLEGERNWSGREQAERSAATSAEM